MIFRETKCIPYPFRKGKSMNEAWVCDHCGLCCQHLIVEANALDVLRQPQIESRCPLGPLAEGLSLLDACWILTSPGACPFLTLQSRCEIYPTRPANCVGFLAGSPQCQELRQEHGWAPLIRQRVADPMVVAIAHAVLAEKQEDVGIP